MKGFKTKVLGSLLVTSSTAIELEVYTWEKFEYYKSSRDWYNVGFPVMFWTLLQD